MSRDKQIEEMALDMSDSLVYFSDEPKIINWVKTLENMYSKGYRKATDVAEEIFKEIEEIAMHGVTPFGLCLMSMGEAAFAKLKKKYESEGEG